MPDKPDPDTGTIFGARFRATGPVGDVQPVKVHADAAERGELARRLGVLAVDEFSADLEARPFTGGFKVSGRVHAGVQQACVVTLEPVVEEVSLEIERVFMRGKSPQPPTPAILPRPGEFVPPERNDPPDWFEGDWVDLDGVLLDTLALALNPYPRAPGAQLEKTDGDDKGTKGPFAALEKFGKDPTGGHD